ncbi:MAG TPA: 50S ribosomal protein L18 [Armatimonadota bacterium]|nr:50S ribosomal protein L18 [Armatimonadota bacterium]
MKLNREAALARRHKRVRARINGTPDRPRLAVHRSLQHIYAQIIDDKAGRTLVAASSNEPAFREKITEEIKGWNKAGASLIGTMIAERAKSSGITEVVFDRGGYPYHGRVKALADGAREGGLEF